MFLSFVFSLLTTAFLAGPERPVPMGVALTPASDHLLALASDGNDYLAVWGYGAASSGLRVNHLSASGDADLVPTAAIDPHSPDLGAAAVWNGSGYVVVWSSGKVMSLVANRDGSLQRPARTLLDGTFRRAVFNGRHILILYSTASQPLRGALLNADGSLVHGDIPIPAPALGTETVSYDVATDGNTFVVFWIEHEPFPSMRDEVMAVRVADSGALLDTAPRRIAGVEGRANSPIGVAFNGSAYTLAFVTTTQGLPTGDGTLTRTLIDPVTLSPQFLPPVATGGGVLRILFDGADTLVFVTRYDGSSNPSTVLVPFSGSSMVAVGVNGAITAAATNGRSILVGLIPVALGERDTVALLDAAGNVLKSSFPFAYAPPTQESPRVASSGQESLVAWTESTLASRSAMAVRVDAASQLLDAQPIVLAQGGAVSDVLFAGTAYYVFYTSRDGQFFVQRLGRDGIRIGNPIALPAQGAAATNGSNILLAVRTFGSEQLAYRIDLEGKLLDPAPFAFTALPRDWGVSNRAVSSNGTDYMVTLAGSIQPCYPFPCPGTEQGLFAARITGGGAPLDLAPIELGRGDRSFSEPAMTWDGRDYVAGYVTADSFNAGAGEARTELRKILPSGALDGGPVTLLPRWSHLSFSAPMNFGTLAACDSGSGVTLATLDGRTLLDIAGAANAQLARVSPSVIEMAYNRLENGALRVYVRRVGNVSPRPRAVLH